MPYALKKSSSGYQVVKKATGQVVPGGNHGSDKAKALAHLRALEINVKN